MNQPDVAAESDTRSANMARRRALILSHARTIIAREGFDALKVRDLASRAGVTTPTIYNLIGGKPDILALIIEELIDRLEGVLQDVAEADIESVFEAQIDKLAELFATDEDYYRAAFIAGDRSDLFEQRSASGIYARSVHLPIEACRRARENGLLRGKVSAEQMGQQIYGCYRLARQDWIYNHIDITAFHTQALTGIFICLAADATPAFHARLLKRLQMLAAE